MNCFLFFSLVTIYSLVLKTNCQNVNISDEDFYRTSPEFIESRGFTSETHTVITTDGYILNFFRIVNPFAKREQISPVLLWHGIGGNSDSWLISRSGILNGSDGIYSEDNNTIINDCHHNSTSTLSFTLSACGYDVWLANSRGGRYSNKHINPLFNEENPLYSDYSITELAIYDVPAVVKYILKLTKKDSLSYIGHSMGTTTMFILLSLKPDFQEYIKPFIAMAPIAYLKDVKSSLAELAPIEPIARPLLFPLGLERTTAQYLGAYLCNNNFMIDECITLLDETYGPDSYNLDKERVPIYLANSLDKISIRAYLHYAQLINSGEFQAFNYPTIAENILKYGQPTPPNYPLNKITSNDIILIKAENDYLSDDTNIEKLVNQLKVPIKGNYTIEWKEWNHADYIWGIHANIYLNPIILNILNDVNDSDLTGNIYYNQIDQDISLEY